MFMMLGLLGADASDAWPVQAFSAGVKAEVRSSRNGADVDDAWLVGVPVQQEVELMLMMFGSSGFLRSRQWC